MYQLEIKTKNSSIKVENPRKARVKDMTLYDAIQIMDEDGKWNTITRCNGLTLFKTTIIEDEINNAIKKRRTTVYLDI